MNLKLERKVLFYLVVFDYWCIGFFLGIGVITSNLIYVLIWITPIAFLTTILLFCHTQAIKEKGGDLND